MPPVMPQTYVLQRSFSDVDELATEARQWNLDFRQLDRGKFCGDVLQFGGNDIGGVHISDARFFQPLRQKGAPPDGMQTIAIPASADMRIQWRGKSIDGQSMMVFPDGAELSSVSGPDFHVYTCSFPNELLSNIGENLELGSMDSIRGDQDAIRIELSTMQKLRSCLRSICNAVRNGPMALSHAGLIRQLTRDLPREMITAIAQAQGECPPATGRKRLAAVERAEAYIEKHACDAVRVSDICRAAGVSERTLEYAFVERFGIGPKEFVNVYRLVSVRRQLSAADPRSTKVSDVANEWGFWHMGQFAADYQQRFEELPSETLRRQNSA